MSDQNSPQYPTLPGRQTLPRAPNPPHPLDSTWYIHLDETVYGPYTGHQLKGYAEEGRIDADTNVLREGTENWTKAGDEKRLSLFFRKPLQSTSTPPIGANATQGSTIVQVTNQIMPLSLSGDGIYGPKSAGVALLLSILICGGGQLYNGQIAKGVLMFFGCVVLWFVLLGWIINIWSWIDAYNTAKIMNARFQQRVASGMSI